MKKKNQELEKFKFVLDYKIKELKRQMEPRENEIKNAKEQIKKVEKKYMYIHVQGYTINVHVQCMCTRNYCTHLYLYMYLYMYVFFRWKWSWVTTTETILNYKDKWSCKN